MESAILHVQSRCVQTSSRLGPFGLIFTLLYVILVSERVKGNFSAVRTILYLVVVVLARIRLLRSLLFSCSRYYISTSRALLAIKVGSRSVLRVAKVNENIGALVTISQWSVNQRWPRDAAKASLHLGYFFLRGVSFESDIESRLSRLASREKPDAAHAVFESILLNFSVPILHMEARCIQVEL